MKLQITGYRAGVEKTVKVEVVDYYEENETYVVMHTDGKIAFIRLGGGTYSRMNGAKYMTLMTDCNSPVEV